MEIPDKADIYLGGENIFSVDNLDKSNGEKSTRWSIVSALSSISLNAILRFLLTSLPTTYLFSFSPILLSDLSYFNLAANTRFPELTREVLKVIKDLKKDNHTMIVVTHEMEFARKVADKVIFMADGVIEEQGSPEEVFGNPKSPKTQAFLQEGEKSIDED